MFVWRGPIGSLTSNNFAGGFVRSSGVRRWDRPRAVAGWPIQPEYDLSAQLFGTETPVDDN
jgi:hypothetical protein